MTHPKFDGLLGRLRAGSYATRRDRRPRERAAGACRRSAHDTPDHLLLALLWLRV
jgi:hypothetical protein